MHAKNPFVRRFKTLLDHDENINDLGAKVVIRADRWTNVHARGVLNAPAIQEDFAAVVSDERSADIKNRDVRVQLKGGPLWTIGEKHRSYDALQYPLILWNAQDGYDLDKKEQGRTKTSALQFYAYQIQQREGSFNTLLRFGRLFSQFVVDVYAKVLSLFKIIF